MEIKVIITGATGMVGEGVLLECLSHPKVKEVLAQLDVNLIAVRSIPN